MTNHFDQLLDSLKTAGAAGFRVVEEYLPTSGKIHRAGFHKSKVIQIGTVEYHFHEDGEMIGSVDLEDDECFYGAEKLRKIYQGLDPDADNQTAETKEENKPMFQGLSFSSEGEDDTAESTPTKVPDTAGNSNQDFTVEDMMNAFKNYGK